MKKLSSIILLFVGLLLSNQALASKTTATSSGNWSEGGIWDNGQPGCFDTIVIPVGVIVEITTQQDLTACQPQYILVQGELTFKNGKKLDLSCGSVVYIDSGPPAGTLSGGGGGCNSNWVKICGDIYWSAGDGDLTGPAILCEACSLPIELIFFEAVFNDVLRRVDLDWATASETDNDFFTIERSINGSDWTELVQVDGAGNSSTRIDYHEIDPKPFYGDSYYRLKQTDFDGEFSYSPIVLITQNGEMEIVAYPNPSHQGDEVVLNFP